MMFSNSLTISMSEMMTSHKKPLLSMCFALELSERTEMFLIDCLHSEELNRNSKELNIVSVFSRKT